MPSQGTWGRMFAMCPAQVPRLQLVRWLPLPCPYPWDYGLRLPGSDAWVRRARPGCGSPCTLGLRSGVPTWGRRTGTAAFGPLRPWCCTFADK